MTPAFYPLAVELNGTLLKTDVSLEQVIKLVHHRPALLLSLAVRHFRSPQTFKSRLADEVTLDIANLPWDADIIALITQHRLAGGQVILVTDSAEKTALQVAEHLGLFDRVVATTPTRHLQGHVKAAFLTEEFGQGRFDYAGNSVADLAVSASARRLYCTAPSPLFGRLDQPRQESAEKVGSDRKPGALLESLRPLQWVKNLLIFVPLLANQSLPDPATAASLTLLFATFCLISSGNYLINDLLDLEDDRRHPGKKMRALARGALWPWTAIQACGGLVLTAAALVFFLPVAVLPWLGAYLFLAFLYSLWLKQVPGLDLACLCAFYGLRIEAGAVVAQIPLSGWLLAFGLAGFLTLGLFKRATELEVRAVTGGASSRRSYQLPHRQRLRTAGFVAGCLASVILAAYSFTHNAALLYNRPRLFLIIAGLGLVANWHFWRRPRTGPHAEDPIRAIFTDPFILVVALISLTLLWLAA